MLPSPTDKTVFLAGYCHAKCTVLLQQIKVNKYKMSCGQHLLFHCFLYCAEELSVFFILPVINLITCSDMQWMCGALNNILDKLGPYTLEL